MGLELDLEDLLKKLRAEAKNISDTHTKIALLSVAKIAEGMLKKINTLETQLEG